MKTPIIKSITIACFSFLVCFMFSAKDVNAQEKPEAEKSKSIVVHQNTAIEDEVFKNFESLRKGVRIRTGSFNLQRTKSYFPIPNGGFVENINTRFDIDFTSIRMLGNNFGLGYKALGSFNIQQGFKGIGYNELAVGPSARYYFYDKGNTLLYGQGNLLMGSLDLSDPNGWSSDLRFRKGFRLGAAQRLSNSLGIFLEAGSDWEGKSLLDTDSQALQLQIGIKLFKFLKKEL